MLGARIKAVIDELRGVRLDVIRWCDSLETLVMNGLKPATIHLDHIYSDLENRAVVVVVDEDQQSLCTTTANATRGMLTAFRHENLIVVLTAANPHPGTIYTSPGANEELVALVRAVEGAP